MSSAFCRLALHRPVCWLGERRALGRTLSRLWRERLHCRAGGVWGHGGGCGVGLRLHRLQQRQQTHALGALGVHRPLCHVQLGLLPPQYLGNPDKRRLHSLHRRVVVVAGLRSRLVESAQALRQLPLQPVHLAPRAFRRGGRRVQISLHLEQSRLEPANLLSRLSCSLTLLRKLAHHHLLPSSGIARRFVCRPRRLDCRLHARLAAPLRRRHVLHHSFQPENLGRLLGRLPSRVLKASLQHLLCLRLSRPHRITLIRRRRRRRLLLPPQLRLRRFQCLL
mmetsp:Transcript_59776/g.133178  ORF Transcript_59776/g.133178 Transcript_59776/m.133178 type:complete len:279 (-) Transcript_59776:149-985(-)